MIFGTNQPVDSPAFMEPLASSAHDAAILFVSDLHGESATEQTLTDAVESRFLKKNGRVRECEVLVGSGGKGESAFLVVDNGQGQTHHVCFKHAKNLINSHTI